MSIKDDTFMLAVVGIGAYIAYQYIKKNGVPNPLAPVGAAVGGALYNALNPGAAGASVTYIATLPDGTKTAVNNNALDSNNNFTVGNQTYNLVQGTPGTGNTAVPVIDPSAIDPNAIDFSAGNF